MHWDGHTIHATATRSLAATKATSQLSLDLQPSMRITRARYDGRVIAVSRSGHVATFATGSLVKGQVGELIVDYVGAPGPVSAPTTRGDFTEGLGWVTRADGSVTTYAEPYGTSTWAPVNETPGDKALFSARVYTPKNSVAIFNGGLCPERDSAHDNVRRWRAAEPMPAYLVSLDIGDFKPHVFHVSDRDVTVYLRPRDEALLPKLQKSITASYEWLTKRLGAYPMQDPSFVLTDGSTAMETQGLISMSSGVYEKEKREVVLHEMAHQWFGDEVTPADWNDLWLSEGSAMFIQLQATPGWYTGADIVRACTLSTADEGQATAPKPVHFGEDVPYMCGAVMLSELRDQVGDAAFWKAFAGWPASRPWGTATRDDFAAYWQRATGKDPRPTMKKWLETANENTRTTTDPVDEAAAASDRAAAASASANASNRSADTTGAGKKTAK